MAVKKDADHIETVERDNNNTIEISVNKSIAISGYGSSFRNYVYVQNEYIQKRLRGNSCSRT